MRHRARAERPVVSLIINAPTGYRAPMLVHKVYNMDTQSDTQVTLNTYTYDMDSFLVVSIDPDSDDHTYTVYACANTLDSARAMASEGQGRFVYARIPASVEPTPAVGGK